MGYLIVRIRPKQDVNAEPLLALAVRAQLGDSSIVGPGWNNLRQLLARHGYEAQLEIARVDPRDYPFTCVAYTSRNRDGEGRSGSSLYRLLCRKLEGQLVPAPKRARDTGQFLKAGACPECGTHGPHAKNHCRLCGSELPPHLQPVAPEESP